MRKRMESYSTMDSNWDGRGFWGNSLYSIDDIFEFSSPLDQSLTSGLQDAFNDEKPNPFAKWMDEKVDLSILDSLEGQPSLLDDLDVMIEDPAALLELPIDWPPEIFETDFDSFIPKPEENKDDAKEALSTSGYVGIPDSPGGRVPDTSCLLSPEYQESLYLNPNPENLPNNKDEIKSEGAENVFNLPKETDSADSSELPNYKNLQLSPSSSVSSIDTVDTIDTNDCCNSEISCNSPLAEEESSTCNNLIIDSECDALKESEKVQETGKVTKRRARCYRKPASDSKPPGEIRRDRKRKQNKDAATRYRQKKRKEDVAIKDEESILDSRNQELKSKVQQLTNEISYLKGLLTEARLRMQSKQRNQEKSNQSCSKNDTKNVNGNNVFLMILK